MGARMRSVDTPAVTAASSGDSPSLVASPLSGMSTVSWSHPLTPSMASTVSVAGVRLDVPELRGVVKGRVKEEGREILGDRLDALVPEHFEVVRNGLERVPALAQRDQADRNLRRTRRGRFLKPRFGSFGLTYHYRFRHRLHTQEPIAVAEEPLWITVADTPHNTLGLDRGADHRPLDPAVKLSNFHWLPPDREVLGQSLVRRFVTAVSCDGIRVCGHGPLRGG